MRMLERDEEHNAFISGYNVRKSCRRCGTTESWRWWKCCPEHTPEYSAAVMCETCRTYLHLNAIITEIFCGPFTPVDPDYLKWAREEAEIQRNHRPGQALRYTQRF